MSEMPAPLTPDNCDLQDFHFMPLQVARLRDSDLAAEEDPEACWYAVLLWSASWHQIPAASLPDNDAVLCKLIGLGRDLRTFRKHKAGALRGFVKCSDGRLYHPVVAEQALASWKGKIEQRWRTECARVRKHNQRYGTDDVQPKLEDFVTREFASSVPFLSQGHTPHGHKDVTPLSHGTAASVPCDIASKGQGQGEGQGDSTISSDIVDAPDDPDKALWADAVALLGENRRGQVAKWITTYGRDAVEAAIGKTALAEPNRPAAYVQSILVGMAKEQAQAKQEAGAEEALFDQRYPPRELSEAEAKALMEPDEFTRWRRRKQSA